MKQFVLILSGIASLLIMVNNFAQASYDVSDSKSLYFSENNESEIYASFNEIEDIVSCVKANENVTYADLERSSFSLSSISSKSALALFPDDEEDNRFQFNNQTAFLMGCLFGGVGILAVALINNGNTAIVNRSIWGCVTTGCVSVGISAAFYIWYFLMLSGGYYY